MEQIFRLSPMISLNPYSFKDVPRKLKMGANTHESERLECL